MHQNEPYGCNSMLKENCCFIRLQIFKQQLLDAFSLVLGQRAIMEQSGLLFCYPFCVRRLYPSVRNPLVDLCMNGTLRGLQTSSHKDQIVGSESLSTKNHEISIDISEIFISNCFHTITFKEQIFFDLKQSPSK